LGGERPQEPAYAARKSPPSVVKRIGTNVKCAIYKLLT